MECIVRDDTAFVKTGINPSPIPSILCRPGSHPAPSLKSDIDFILEI
jgi:hypothetical protein